MRDIQLHHIGNLSAKNVIVEDQSSLINANFKAIADVLAQLNKDFKGMATCVETLNKSFGKISKYLNNK